MAQQNKAPALNVENSMQDLYVAVDEWLIRKWLWLSFKLYSDYDYHVNWISMSVTSPMRLETKSTEIIHTLGGLIDHNSEHSRNHKRLNLVHIRKLQKIMFQDATFSSYCSTR